MTTMPSVFVSHGAPTYALEPGLAGQQLTMLGKALQKPSAIVVFSPHWMTQGVRITAAIRPETIYDFSGFARELYSLKYPAPGNPALAAQIARLLKVKGIEAEIDDRRGLDHGAWVPLMHMFPDADIPVVQVSIPFDANERQCLELGQALSSLGEQGILVVGSGSLTHNLYEFRGAGQTAQSYVIEFTQWVRNAVIEGDVSRLVQALRLAPHAARAHPTTEHYLPLLIAAGAASSLVPSTVLDGGVYHGMLAMESYVFGQKIALQ